MKIIATLFILFLSTFSSENDKIRIEWSERDRLSWEDFQGYPQGAADYVASTNSGISFSFSYSERNGKRDLTYTIKSHFYPKLSWYKPELVSEYILKHEQAHFDISELYARILRKKLEEADFSKNVKEEIEIIYEENEEERRTMQNRFDEETDHSKIPEKEYGWRKYIAKQLEVYERWK